MMTWSQIIFQDSNSPVMEEFIYFHDHILIFLIVILMYVSLILYFILQNSLISKSILEAQILECVWTLVPAIILIQIAVPSLLLLYFLEESVEISLTIKSMGHQWFWTYEYSDFWNNDNNFEVESYMVPSSELTKGFRLLETDNRISLPYNTNTRVLVGSSDVLHAWTIPALGVKADACPGRLNQVMMLINRPGLFFGQCSEICGANHSFMPIALEVLNSSDFLNWVEILEK